MFDDRRRLLWNCSIHDCFLPPRKLFQLMRFTIATVRMQAASAVTQRIISVTSASSPKKSLQAKNRQTSQPQANITLSNRLRNTNSNTIQRTAKTSSVMIKPLGAEARASLNRTIRAEVSITGMNIEDTSHVYQRSHMKVGRLFLPL